MVRANAHITSSYYCRPGRSVEALCAGAQAATGGTYTSSGGNSIHTFTGDGTFTTASIYAIN